MKNRSVYQPWKIIVIAMVLLALFIPGATCTKNRPTKVIHFSSTLQLGDGYKTVGSSVCTIKITNGDGFDWHKVQLTVDELYLYKTVFETVKPGETLTVSLPDFLMSGTPFDVKRYVPAKVGVITDEGSYFNGWTNIEGLGK